MFISYSHVDMMFVQGLTNKLDEIGIEYFLDEKDINWGADITKTITGALKSCSSVLLIISPASLKSGWVPFEIGQATALNKTVLPLLTHPSLEVPGYLQGLKYKTQLGEVIEVLKNASRNGAGKHQLAEIHERLKKGDSISGSDRIDLIRQIAEGPPKFAGAILRSCLE